MREQEWRLRRGGDVLAILRSDGQALMPGLDGHFTVEAAYEPTLAFDAVRQLFEREAALLDVLPDEADEQEQNEYEDIWEELEAPGMFLESPDGRERIAIAWIHFKDGRAWWWPLYASPETVLLEDIA